MHASFVAANTVGHHEQCTVCARAGSAGGRMGFFTAEYTMHIGPKVHHHGQTLSVHSIDDVRWLHSCVDGAAGAGLHMC